MEEGDALSAVRAARSAAAKAEAYDVALAACRALVPTDVRPKPDIRRALVLAKFAVAMTK